MKAAVIAVLISGFTAGAAFAEMDIPRSVKRVEQLAEAKTEAASEEKFITYVLTDPGTT